MNKKTIIYCILGAVLLVVFLSVITYHQSKDKDNKFHATPLAPVEKLISTLYFKQGTYSDYKTLFSNKNNVISEKEFKSYQFMGQPNVIFPVDNDSVANVMKHMKQQQIDPNTVKVFWSKDLNGSANSLEEATATWVMIKQNGKWYIGN